MPTHFIPGLPSCQILATALAFLQNKETLNASYSGLGNQKPTNITKYTSEVQKGFMFRQMYEVPGSIMYLVIPVQAGTAKSEGLRFHCCVGLSASQWIAALGCHGTRNACTLPGGHGRTNIKLVL